ncbi:MAG: hypothetical protein HYV09_22100 [Deltaproteobacteria bacterium]|nr:hypothetical protein [Deltaproteobacteria bacterium]
MGKVTAVCLMSLALGCGGRLEGADGAAATGPDATVSADAHVDTSPIADALPDSAPERDAPISIDTAPPESLAACLGEFGDSDTSRLKDLIYVWDPKPGSGDGKGTVGFTFNVGCTARTEGMLVSPKSALIEASDCELLRKWATSALLLGALAPESPAAIACRAKPGDGFERTTVGGTGADLHTSFCDVEPFVTHRQCLKLVRKKYGLYP